MNYTQNEFRQAVARRAAAGLAALALMLGAGAAQADEGALVLGLDYKADLTGVAAGGIRQGGRALDNLTIAADLDLDKAVGWRGGALHLELLANNGGTPGALAGNLQGVDNIEVGRPGTKLFQAWFEQALAGDRASVRVGFSDLNSEFYAADAAGLLIAPGFGIGSELAATGPAGPSIFPSTAFGVRLKLNPTPDSYVQAAVINAQAGVPGDPGGPDWSFDDGVLTIAEAGWTGGTRLAVGVWSWSERMDDIRETDGLGQPLQRRGHGAYAIAERELTGSWPKRWLGGRTANGFLKLGLSDGRTSDFSGGWQAGVLIEKPAASRPDSLLSFGVTQAWMSPGAVKNLRDTGGDPAHVETQFEITWSDKLSDHVTLQPDLQYILSPGGDRSVDDALVLALRLGIGF